MNHLFKPGLLLGSAVTAPLLFSFPVHAAGAGPDSGSILQQVRPAPTAPAQPPSPLQLQQAAEDSPSAASVPFAVTTIRIAGNTVFSTEALHALVASQENRTLTLAQLDELAHRITAYYQERGFPLSRAIVPAQTLDGGGVTIRVIEARLGEVRLDNRSRVSGALLNETLQPLKSGEIITERALDRSLLLLTDMPGVNTNAVIKPGNAVGTADLGIDVTRARDSVANLSLDNYGNRYIGRTRLNGTASLLNPSGRGDLFSASVVSTGSDMNFGRASYDTLLNGQGLRAGLAYSEVHYSLRNELSALGANGTAKLASLWLRYPVLRSRSSNLYAQLQYDAKHLRDRIESAGTRTDRHLDNAILSLNGDMRDQLLGGGTSLWSVGISAGRVAFDDADALAADAASARTSGSFSKWSASFSRQQSLNLQYSLYLNLSAQWADSNLDSSEKIVVGGPNSVRAYGVGAISADHGYVGTLELRRELGSFAAGRWQAQGFIDGARVTVNQRPWSVGDNTATLSGAGVGLSWTGPDAWSASLSVAARLGPAPALASDVASARGWIALSKAF